jgi:hypothetical protein
MRTWKLGIVAFVLGCLSLLGGWGMAWALAPNPSSTQASPTFIAQEIPTSAIKKNLGTPIPENPRSVDPIPTRYLPGFESYIQTCTGCHIALPPEVLPLESWQEILRRPDQHYGVSIPNINRFTQLLIWDYVSTFSRPLPPDSPVPIYTEKSRYFKALHPKVPLTPETTAKTCITCHPQVSLFDFVTLSPEWQDAP